MKKSVGTKIDQEIFDEFRRSIFVLTEGRKILESGMILIHVDLTKNYQSKKIKPKKTSISLSGDREGDQKVKIIDPGERQLKKEVSIFC